MTRTLNDAWREMRSWSYIRGSWGNKASAVPEKQVASEQVNLADCCPRAQTSA
jgi:hypothetical protein